MFDSCSDMVSFWVKVVLSHGWVGLVGGSCGKQRRKKGQRRRQGNCCCEYCSVHFFLGKNGSVKVPDGKKTRKGNVKG
jgi:hypothetical protein